MGIEKVENTSPLQTDNVETKKVAQKKDTTPVPVGQPTENTQQKPADEENPYAESKIHYVDLKILDKRKELTVINDPKKKAAIEKEIKVLEAQKARQKQTAKLEATEDGDIKMTLLKSSTAAELKKTFNISDGALREYVPYEWVDYENPEQGQYKKYNENAEIPKGKKIILDPASIDNQGGFTEIWNKIFQ